MKILLNLLWHLPNVSPPLRAGIYLLKVSNINTRAMCEKCSKLSVKTPERRRSSVFIFVNLKHISYIVLSVFIVNFKSGPQFWNPRNFWAWFSICTRDWLKHRFLNEKESRNQMLNGQNTKVLSVEAMFLWRSSN